MDHERYPYYFDNAAEGAGNHAPSLPNAFVNVIEVLRRLLSREPDRLPTR